MCFAPAMSSKELLDEARRALGIDQLILGVHDASFPSATGEDVGRGSPYSRGARELMDFARELGFTGLQLGPQGETTPGNRSPYDGTVLSKSVLSIDFPALARDPHLGPLVAPEVLRALVAGRPSSDGRVAYEYAFRAVRAAVQECWKVFQREAPLPLRARYEGFRAANADWLDHDEAYEHSTGSLHLGEAFAFGQFLVHAQHDATRAASSRAEWTTYGDLQVGLSLCDRWRREAMFLDGYAMGAPPSRTDPAGQPWGYPVQDPRSGDGGILALRIDKMLREMDGVRIDHPHGIVCPWVYDTRVADPMVAVKQGARLFASPDLSDHPELARFAIARPEQLDRTVARHADGWIRTLDDAQVAAYASRVDRIATAMRDRGHDPRGLMCEVLSTCPYPLERVMGRYGLGRFRVTQKANPDDPNDGYRSENARPGDWIMVGNHDTRPLLLVVDRWRDEGVLGARARYLAERLSLDAGALEASPSRIVQAMFADLFAGPARNVMVFVADLLGTRATYNRPGIVDDVNWTWRVPHDFRQAHRENRVTGEAMDVPRAMATALRAKGGGKGENQALADALDSFP